MNVAITAYVPPPSFPGARAFLENIRAWTTKHELILFSDHDYGPDVVRVKASPEVVKPMKYPDGRPNTFAIQNLLFITAMRIIEGRGFTHMIYVEADCRVGAHDWDARLVTEFECEPLRPLIAGTAVMYNAHNRDMAFSRRVMAFLGHYQGARFPIVSFGGIGAATAGEPAVLINGALGIYDLDYVRRIMPMDCSADGLSKLTAFDYHIGREMVREFNDNVFDQILHLNCVYSSYGDIQTSEQERLQMLINGEVVAVHQVKSDNVGPLPPPRLILPPVEPLACAVDNHATNSIPCMSGARPARAKRAKAKAATEEIKP